MCGTATCQGDTLVQLQWACSFWALLVLPLWGAYRYGLQKLITYYFNCLGMFSKYLLTIFSVLSPSSYSPGVPKRMASVFLWWSALLFHSILVFPRTLWGEEEERDGEKREHWVHLNLKVNLWRARRGAERQGKQNVGLGMRVLCQMSHRVEILGKVSLNKSMEIQGIICVQSII